MSIFHAKPNSGRRAFLRGAGGIALGLPLLEFTHEKAWAAGPGGLKRFVTVFAHGGETMNISQYTGTYRDGTTLGPRLDDWRPIPGSNARFGVAHQTFVESGNLLNKLIVVRGVDNVAGNHVGDPSHYNGEATCLTAARNVGLNNEGVYALGPSIDWVLAQRMGAKLGGRATPLHFTVAGFKYKSPFWGGTLGERCTEQGGQHNPRLAFEATFGDVDFGSSEPDRAVERAREVRTSILNGLSDGYRGLAQKLGKADRAILEAHLDHLTDLEKQIANTGGGVLCQEPLASDRIDDPSGYGSARPAETAIAMGNLIVAAFRCGLAHVANLQIHDIMTPFPAQEGFPHEGHDLGHQIQRFGSDTPDPSEGFGLGGAAEYATWLDKMRKTRRWRLEVAKHVAAQLNDPAFPEGDGTMLDNSIVMYTSEFSCAGAHASGFDMPYVLLGSAGGYLKTESGGRLLELNPKRIANPNDLGWAKGATAGELFTTFLQAAGETDTTFGVPEYAHRTGGIAELVA